MRVVTFFVFFFSFLTPFHSQELFTKPKDKMHFKNKKKKIPVAA